MMCERDQDAEQAWEEIFEAVDAKALDLSEEDIRAEIQAAREERRDAGSS